MEKLEKLKKLSLRSKLPLRSTIVLNAEIRQIKQIKKFLEDLNDLKDFSRSDPRAFFELTLEDLNARKSSWTSQAA